MDHFKLKPWSLCDLCGVALTVFQVKRPVTIQRQRLPGFVLCVVPAALVFFTGWQLVYLWF